MGPITVVIADDHGVVREGLRVMLEREGFEVVGEAATGREATAASSAPMASITASANSVKHLLFPGRLQYWVGRDWQR